MRQGAGTRKGQAASRCRRTACRISSLHDFYRYRIMGAMSTMPINEFLNVEEAAAVIGVTEGRVRQMLRWGEMAGKKANKRAWLVTKEEAERVAAEERKTGRPRSGS